MRVFLLAVFGAWLTGCTYQTFSGELPESAVFTITTQGGAMIAEHRRFSHSYYSKGRFRAGVNQFETVTEGRSFDDEDDPVYENHRTLRFSGTGGAKYIIRPTYSGSSLLPGVFDETSGYVIVDAATKRVIARYR